MHEIITDETMTPSLYYLSLSFSLGVVGGKVTLASGLQYEVLERGDPSAEV
jgi:hypothetical protein